MCGFVCVSLFYLVFGHLTKKEKKNETQQQYNTTIAYNVRSAVNFDSYICIFGMENSRINSDYGMSQ